MEIWQVFNLPVVIRKHALISLGQGEGGIHMVNKQKGVPSNPVFSTEDFSVEFTKWVVRRKRELHSAIIDGKMVLETLVIIIIFQIMSHFVVQQMRHKVCVFLGKDIKTPCGAPFMYLL